MARFQATTNAVLDRELEMLREQLGLAPNEKAELLREVAALASWVVRQTRRGRTVEARRGSAIEPLDHPAITRLRTRAGAAVETRIVLDDDAVKRLAEVLNRPFAPTPGLRKSLANLADPKRKPPKLRWKKPAA